MPVLLLIACLCLAGNYTCRSQDKVQPPAKNTLYFQLAGNSLSFGLVNYDRILVTRSRWKFAGRMGLAMVPYSRPYKAGWGVPVDFNFLVGRTKHFFEVGAGFTYYYGLMTQGGERLSTYYFLNGVGYRYQRPQGGLFLQAGLDMIVGLNEIANYLFSYSEKVWIYGGLSVGYTFKR